MTVAIDFDGVVHAYSRGWQDGGIYDEPVPGALDALRALMAAGPVFIFTAREPVHVAVWLAHHGIPTRADVSGDFHFWNERGVLLVTNRKLPALVYVDDRGVRFESWPETLEILAQLGVPGTEPFANGDET